LLVPALALLALFPAALQLRAQVRQTNLVSDIPGRAIHTDANLVNPWGISSSAGSPFWVSNGGTATSTIYNSNGVPSPLVVTIPPAASGGPAVPTGQVFNGGNGFNSDLFIFASAGGTITGWRGALGTTAETLVDNSGSGASYFGLAVGSVGTDRYLYAADFGNNQITVLPNTGAPALSGSFSDPTLPSGYSPFNIQNVGGSLYVTYALKDTATGEEVVGLGNGYVNKFDLSGNLITRFASNGPLDAPWGLAVAPTSFGALGGALLVGNFGDGTINAFDPTSGEFIDALRDSFGNPIVNEGLWGIIVGNGGNGGRTDSLYFAAGIDDETHGLFGRLSPVPEPSITGLSAGVMLAGLSAAAWRRRRKNKLAKDAHLNSPVAETN
jgi:uncharacterized protein (TIGR03118 family)